MCGRPGHGSGSGFHQASLLAGRGSDLEHSPCFRRSAGDPRLGPGSVGIEPGGLRSKNSWEDGIDARPRRAGASRWRPEYQLRGVVVRCGAVRSKDVSEGDVVPPRCSPDICAMGPRALCPVGRIPGLVMAPSSAGRHTLEGSPSRWQCVGADAPLLVGCPTQNLCGRGSRVWARCKLCATSGPCVRGGG